MKVTAILKGRKDSNGQQPIQIRIADGKKRSFVSTKMRVSENQLKKGRVIAHPKASEYNKEIERLIIIHQSKVLAGEKKEKRIDFYEYFERLMLVWEHEKEDSTLRCLRSQKNVLQEFAPSLVIQDIDEPFLTRYKVHRHQQVESTNTVWASFKFLKTIINQALRDGTLKADPFATFKRPKYQAARKVYLTESELQAFEAAIPETVYEKYGYWFLIACYTGLRVSDLLQFDYRTHIVNGRLTLHTLKTGEIVSLKMNEQLEGYLAKVDRRPLGCAAETYREKIKIIAGAAKIKKHISTHTARHTFGVLCASKGVPIEVCKRFMAHTDIKSTEVYYQIAGTVMDEHYQKLF